MGEKEIEQKVCKYAKDQGFEVYKFSSPARAAVPDRIFIRNGVALFVEFKAPGKKPTAPQKREHERLRIAGMPVHVVDSVEYGRTVVDSYRDFLA